MPLNNASNTDRSLLLRKYGFQEMPTDESFKDILRLATIICETPIAYISILDDKKQYILDQEGIRLDTIPVETSICQHTITNEEILVIEDTLEDDRTKDLPIVNANPSIGFYAGFPLTNKERETLGAFCVMDYHARKLNHKQREALQILGGQIMQAFEFRKQVSNTLTIATNELPVNLVQKVDALEKALLNTTEKLISQNQTIKIEKQKQQEVNKELLQQKRELQLVTDVIPACISFVDRNYCYQLNNSEYEKWFGITKEELKGKHVKFIIGEESFNEQLAYFRQVFSGKVVQFEKVIRTIQKERCLRVRYIPAYDVDGEVIGTYVFAEDITELKQNQANLEKSNEGLKSFAYAASHDIRSPLRNIKGMGKLLKKELEEQGVSYNEKCLDYILESADQLDDLTNDLLTYTKIDQSAIQVEQLSVNAILEMVKSNLKEQIETKGATIIHTDKEVVLSINRTDGIQLFQNIISNAIKYQEKGNVPMVEVLFDQVDEWCEIAIKDNGIGIAKKHLDEVFKPFTRLHAHSEYSGSGIGLATCKKIVERYNSALGIDSVVGEGTVFSFKLPCF